MKNLDKVLTIATKIRTPLSIAGLSVIILYLTVRQILSLDVYSNVGGERTYLLLSNVLDKVFFLALIALILGICSYLLTILLSNKKNLKRSKVSILDASNDGNMSNYTEITTSKGKKIIRPNGKD